MYRIKYINIETGIICVEYAFAKKMMKIIHNIFNETNHNGYSIYELMDISILCFSLKTFKKCLTNHLECSKI